MPLLQAARFFTHDILFKELISMFELWYVLCMNFPLISEIVVCESFLKSFSPSYSIEEICSKIASPTLDWVSKKESHPIVQ